MLNGFPGRQPALDAGKGKCYALPVSFKLNFAGAEGCGTKVRVQPRVHQGE
jgi:hypothetical protein